MRDKKVKALLIVDNPDDLLIIQKLLEESTNAIFDLKCADTLSTGLEYLSNNRFDVILCDLSLADSSGLKTYEIICNKAQDIAIIVMTGLNDETVAIEAMRKGAQDYLVKGEADSTHIERAIQNAIERKAAANALIESANSFKSLFEVASDLIFVVDSNYVIIRVNPAAYKRIGYSENDLIGKRFVDLFTPSSKDLFVLQVSTLLGIGTHRQELELMCKNGESIPVDSSIAAIDDAKGVQSLITISLRDITRFKKEEDELRSGKDLAESVNRQVSDELEMAKEIQQGLYPRKIPEMDGIEITADLFQARQVGGDYYDIIPLSDHEMAFLIADVAGHDIASAFIVGMAKISFQAHIPVYSSLAEILKHVNEDMGKVVTENRFLSAFIAVIDTQTMILKYANAGHFRQCLYHANTKELELLTTQGMFIGAFDDGDYEEKSCKLDIGDKLVLFTDGLFENCNSNEEQYSQKRLHKFIRNKAYNNVQILHDLILNDYRRFCEDVPPNDDTCLAIIEAKECAYHSQVITAFDNEFPNLPAVLLDSKRAADETIGNILTMLDENNYSDTLIRHYKKTIHVIINAFLVDSCSKYCHLRAIARIDNKGLKIAFLIENRNINKVEFFITGACREILTQFHRSFGSIEVNEDSTRLLFSYEKETTIEEKTKDISFDIRADGTFFTVPENLAPFTTIESVTEELISKGIVNANFSLIKEALLNKSGKPAKIGKPFKKYNRDKNQLFKLTLNTIEAKILLVESKSGIKSLTKEELKFILRNKRVNYGIQTDVLNEIVINPQYNIEYVISSGKAPVDGNDANLNERMKIDTTKTPIIKQDGSVDHKVLDLLESVKAGNVLIEKSPATPGVPGISIFGRTIDPRPGEDKKLPAGKNTEVSKDGTCLIAKTDGYLHRNKDGVHVRQLYLVDRNVDYSTGNIKYAGDVFIEGDVLSGFKVESKKNISINGKIESAEIISDKGDIDCRKGVLGKGKARVCTSGSIYADFIQESTIHCKGHLNVKKSILNVKAEVNGNITIGTKNDGLILGGQITSNGCVRTAEIGNEKHIKTIILIAEKHSERLKQRFIKINKNRNELKEKFVGIESQLKVKSQLFKLKTKRSQEQKKDIEKLLKSYYMLKQKTGKVEKIVVALKQKMDKEASCGRVEISKAIHPNVTLQFGDLERKITTKMGPSIFTIINGKIVILPYRQ